MATLYDVLGANPTGTFCEIRACFKRRALEVHPDKGGSKEAFQQVLAAFELLSSRDTRATYDVSIATAQKITTQFTDATHGVEFERPRGKKRNLDGEPRSRNGKSARADRTFDGSGQQFKNDAAKAPCATAPGMKKGRDAPVSSGNYESPGLPKGDELTHGETRVLEKLQRILSQLSRGDRHWVVLKILSQSLRLALRDWMEKRTGEDQPMDKRCAARTTEQALSKINCQTQEESSSSDGDEDVGASDVDVENKDTSLPSKLNENVPLMLCDKTHESDSNDESEPLVLAQVEHWESHNTRSDQSSGRSQVRGISCKSISGKLYYKAQVTLGTFIMSCRSCTDLSRAVDHLSVLAVMRQRVLSGARRFSVECVDVLADRMRLAHQKTLEDIGTEAACDLGLSFKLQLTSKYWIGKRTVYTRQTSDFEEALTIWRRFGEVQQELICNDSGSVLCSLLSRFSPLQLAGYWNRFKEAYIEAICAQTSGGASCLDGSGPFQLQPEAMSIDARLEAMAAANSRHRERMMEAWNGRRMREEEKQQRRRFRKQLHLSEKARYLVKQWEGIRQRWMQRQQAALAQQAANQRRLQREYERRLRSERKQRWRQFKGRHLTMEEILGKRP